MDEIKNKIAKVLELTRRGIEGEREAAEIALNRLMRKYNISDEELTRITFREYHFKYATNLDIDLFMQLVSYFFKGRQIQVWQTPSKRQLEVSLEYLDWVTLDCAYAYFRKHAAEQFREFCLPHIRRCRSAKTKNARRAQLQADFYSKYVIASGIYHPEQLNSSAIDAMSARELQEYLDRQAIVAGVQGGQFHAQVAKQTQLIS